MQHRRLGHTELTVSTLSLGTVALGMAYGIAPRAQTGQSEKRAHLPPPPAEAVQLLHRAIDIGINFIDTARGYGSSESIIGQALRERRDEVVLATKVNCLDTAGRPLQGKALRQRIVESVATSLQHLQTEWIDLLMLHSAPIQLLAAGEAVALLKEIQAQGLTRYIGASTYGVEAPRLAIEQGVDALQVAYNVLDQRMADEIFPLAQSRGVGIVVRSVFLKGALTERAEGLPDHLESLKFHSRAFRQYASQLQPPLTAAQLALRFALARSDVATILVGVRSEAELAEAAAAANADPLPASVVADLEKLRADDLELLDPGKWGTA